MESSNTRTLRGSRLRTARAASGFSTRAVANQLQQFGIAVSHTTVGSYERGITDVPSSVLSAFAELYERPFEWLLGHGLSFDECRYRALKKTVGSPRADFETRALGLVTLYFELEERLGETRNSQPSLKALDMSAAELAAAVRQHLGLGEKEPIRSVTWIAETYGIAVVDQAGPAGLDAFAARTPHRHVIVLNDCLSADRMRLTAGHELGHVLYEDCASESKLTDSEIEDRAFEFASHLLMPSSVLADAFRLRSMVRLLQFKKRYGISIAAMVMRAHREGLIQRRLYERLWREMSSLGWRKVEPGHVQSDRPSRLEVLLDTAVRSKRMTLSEAAAISSLSEEHLRRRLAVAMDQDPDLDQTAESDDPYVFQRYQERKDAER